MRLNQRAQRILVIRKMEAYKFFCRKSFFTYMRGPLMKAIPIIILSIAKVKHITNLAGTTTSEGSKKKHISRKKAATANEIVELMIDLSFPRKLKTASQP